MIISSQSLKPPNLRLAILVLAAGEGSRLGGFPKALLEQGGVSLLERFCKVAQQFSPVEILVVTGFYSNHIQQEILSFKQDLQVPINWINNSHPELGQSSSVRLGLESLKNHYDALLIALCDQPNIDAPELSELLWQFSDRAAGQEIVLPIFDGQRGNPVVFSKMVIETILAIPGMVCRPYMDQHPELVKQFTSNTQAYVLDVDTEEDIQKLGLDRIKRD